MAIRTFLVDDSAEFLDAALRFLSMDPKIEIIGFAVSGPEALKEISQQEPDLVLMDLAMPGMNGLEATRLLKEQENSPRVIILTLHDIPEYRTASQDARADGFIAKSEFGTLLLPEIHTLFQEEQTTVK